MPFVDRKIVGELYVRDMIMLLLRTIFGASVSTLMFLNI